VRWTRFSSCPGDRDLEEAVRVAQGAGCKVVLAHPPTAGAAVALRHVADARLPIDAVDLLRMLHPVQPAMAAAAAEPGG
jgi:hypothetical protein